MSSFTLLQPHLMTTEQLRDHLKVVSLDKIQSIVFPLFCLKNHIFYSSEISKSKSIGIVTR